MTTNSNSRAIPGYRAGTWRLDQSKSKIEFEARQFGTRVRGRLTDVEATVITGDALVSGSSVEASFQLGSLDTGNRRRDRHLLQRYLRSRDWPTGRYRSTEVMRDELGNTSVDGTLSLLGVTAPVRLALDVVRFADDHSDEGHRAIFRGSTLIERSRFRIDMPLGRTVISDRVRIAWEVEAVLVDGGS